MPRRIRITSETFDYRRLRDGERSPMNESDDTLDELRRMAAAVLRTDPDPPTNETTEYLAAFFEDLDTRICEHGRLPSPWAHAAAVGLLERIREDIEKPDGRWYAADVTETVIDWLRANGADPDQRSLRTPDAGKEA